MGDRTSIEWTDATWTPVKGCTRASEGCRNCYAEIMAARFSKPGQWGEGLAEIVDTPQGKDHRWTGKVRFDDAELLKPLSWRAPRHIFVCSTADLFHESVPDEWIDRVFAVMALCPQHTFQVLTKRAGRMRKYFAERTEARNSSGAIIVSRAAAHCETWASLTALKTDRALPWRDKGLPGRFYGYHNDMPWPLSNVWLGVSVEDRNALLQRAGDLRQTVAAKRFFSFEPLIGDPGEVLLDGIDWAIVGGESGPGARPMLAEWARSLRDQCIAAGVPFFFKQWGAWLPAGQIAAQTGLWSPKCGSSLLTTKKNAGSLLDGVEHREMPV